MNRLNNKTSDSHHRRSIRLKEFDYSQAGAYFITICTHQRENLFGEIVDESMKINEFGQIAQEEWQKTALIRGEIDLGEFVIMPNHFHGIIWIVDGKPVVGSIPTIVRAFKSAVSRRINLARCTPGKPVWQRNYWEHIIRDEKDLLNTQTYILNNPAQWENDEMHSRGIK